MPNTLLNVSGKLSSFEVEIFDSIDQVTSQFELPYLVVGASARDLVLHHVHGIEIIRATRDMDFAIQVESWDDFHALKTKLMEMGFTESDQQQRVISPIGIPVDIVPFGGVENAQAWIRWQPEDAIEMHVLGFREACEHAETVRLREHPPLDIPIVTMAGLSILKIVAWSDRAADARRKDAIDLLHLLRSHERIPAINQFIYEVEGLLQQYGWDTTLAGAHLLGVEAAKISRPATTTYLVSLQAGELPLRLERLVEEMSRDDDQYERNHSLLMAYFAGLNRKEPKNVLAEVL